MMSAWHAASSTPLTVAQPNRCSWIQIANNGFRLVANGLMEHSPQNGTSQTISHLIFEYPHIPEADDKLVTCTLFPLTISWLLPRKGQIVK